MKVETSILPQVNRLNNSCINSVNKHYVYILDTGRKRWQFINNCSNFFREFFWFWITPNVIQKALGSLSLCSVSTPGSA